MNTIQQPTNREEFLRLFPRSSESTLRANGFGLSQPAEHFTPRSWTVQEVEFLNAQCSDPLKPIVLKDLASHLKRSRASVAIKLSKLGLGSRVRLSDASETQSWKERNKDRLDGFAKRRKEIADEALRKHDGLPFKEFQKTEKYRIEASKRQKWLLQHHGHPKGFKGKTHSDETKRRISETGKGRKIPREAVVRRMKTNLAVYGTVAPNFRKGSTWKAQWVEIGGQKFYARSLWEANYGRYLEFLKAQGEVISWEHEPHTFWFDKVKRGCVSYLPDFRVTLWTGDVEYHEVKGWMDPRSKTKIKRMAKYYPLVRLIVVDAQRYKSISKKAAAVVPGWVTSTTTGTPGSGSSTGSAKPSEKPAAS